MGVMSYTDLRDFHAEYSIRIMGFTVNIEKLGGGTVGESYEGTWRYIVTDPGGQEVARGQDLRTGTPHTHRAAVIALVDFLADDGRMPDDAPFHASLDADE
jgi:hypothetical protein